MSYKTVYLDNSATTMVCPEAAQKVMEAMTSCYGNPSSRHSMGIRAEELVSAARGKIADTLGCRTEEVYFTSGGTESNNLALFGAAAALHRIGNRIVTTQIEHSSVLEAAKELQKRGFDVVFLKPDSKGRISPDDIFKAVTKDTILVSMMLVNNETGTLQPLASAKEAVRNAGSPALVHCDAVQAFCKTKVNPKELGADLISVSSHKIHGPKGAGALYVRNGARILPLCYGGGQEKGLRPGTEAVPLISGFGEAAYIAYNGMAEFMGKIAGLKSLAVNLLRDIPGVVVNSPEDAAANILNISVTGIRSEVMLNYLSAENIYISSGSACSRGRKSHVLAAMGIPEYVADSALRISFSRYNTREDVLALSQGISQAAASLQKTKLRAKPKFAPKGGTL